MSREAAASSPGHLGTQAMTSRQRPKTDPSDERSYLALP